MSVHGVVLGGEHRGRSILGGRRSRAEWIGLAFSGGVALLVILGGGTSVGSILLGLVVAAAGFATFTTWEGMFGDRSPAMHLYEAGRHTWRRRTGRTVFVPAYAAGTVSPRRGSPVSLDVPDALGRVRVLNIDFPDGAQIALLRHSNPGTSPFLTVTFEMQGGVGGLADDDEAWRTHRGWARFTAAMARHGSLVTGLQQTARVVPFDTKDHELWLVGRAPATGRGTLLERSYLELLESIPQQSEQHRTWLTIRMPQSADWLRKARLLAPGDDGHRLLAMEQVRAVVKRAQVCGLALRPLSEARLGGVVRSLQDPTQPLDLPATGGLRTAFLPMDDTSTRLVVVHGERDWYTRTAFVTSRSLSGAMLAPDFLRPLLTNVDPSVIRTISSSVLLTPSTKARTQARADASRDKAALRESKSVSDGSDEVQAAGSQVRLEDLRPGSGVHGASWALAVSYSAESAEALQAADEAIGAAADASSITTLHYADGHHQAAALAVLPFARGISEAKRWL